MPVLPLIDLLILMAWTCLIAAFIEKTANLALAGHYRVLGMEPFDWAVTGAICLLFALALAARVWVKATEPTLVRLRRERLAKAGAEVLPDFPDPRAQAVASDRAASDGAAGERVAREDERSPARAAAR